MVCWTDAARNIGCVCDVPARLLQLAWLTVQVLCLHVLVLCSVLWPEVVLCSVTFWWQSGTMHANTLCFFARACIRSGSPVQCSSYLLTAVQENWSPSLCERASDSVSMNMIMSDIHDPLVTAKPTSKAHSLQHKKDSQGKVVQMCFSGSRSSYC